MNWKKYIERWTRLKAAIRKDFDVEPVHDGKYLIDKMKPYKHDVKTDFDDYGFPSGKTESMTYSIILNDLISKTDKSCHYPQNTKHYKKFSTKDLIDSDFAFNSGFVSIKKMRQFC